MLHSYLKIPVLKSAPNEPPRYTLAIAFCMERQNPNTSWTPKLAEAVSSLGPPAQDG